MHSTHSAFLRSLGQLIPFGVAVTAALGLAACRSEPAGTAPSVSSDAWAVVDGRQIMREDVERAFRRTQDTSQALSAEEAVALKMNLLDEMITQDLLVAKARELQIELPDSELDTAYAEAKQNLADDAFQQELTKRKLTAADMRDGLRRQLLAQKVLEREVESKVTVTDQEIADFYNANRAQFNIPEESYRIAQIVVTPVKEPQIANRTGNDATSPQAAEAKMRMITEQLKDGTGFSQLAADYSEDPESAPRGGDLGFVPVSTLKQAPPQLRDAVLNKAPGTVNVVRAEGAYTIVLVVAREPAGQRDLSMPAVKESISETLRSRRQQVLRAAYLTTLRNDADVVNYLARRLVEGQGKVPSLVPTAPGR